ncbi:MAG: RNA polymerase sigma factor [Aquamicrobium sp.]|uniref:RNA polymerase sigma factor n=1 Tax=Aquamicrobium sp. TaxID=1872579 RepID=UPI00349E9E07|nr:RNA polymerase sigma factor [Aquamicrobium sp.]
MSNWSRRLAGLFAEHRGKLESLVTRSTGDREAASDIVQDVFSRVLACEQASAPEDSVKILYASARNATIDHVRMQNRRREILERVVPEQIAPDVLMPDSIVEGRQALMELDQRLMELGRTTRDIFLLRRVHGVSNAEIARRYGISVSAVEKHVARALRYCQKGLSARSD